MESPDTFTLLDVFVDPGTKAVTSPSTRDTTLQAELATLNSLHRTFVGLETPNSVPLPPMQINPKRSQQIAKLRESGNAAYKKNSFPEAIKLYSLAIDMALGRPAWEPQGLVREEVSALLANRAQAHMSQREWADAAVDAETSVELKKVQNAKAWWRRGKCLVEMGRVSEAREWIARGLEFGEEPDLLSLRKEIT